MKLSVTLATFNEEKNLPRCLAAIKELADEIVVVDGGSTDKTRAIAKKYQAKVLLTDNPTIFHINKQKALDLSKGEWILQLDADEVVSPKLAKEIRETITWKDQKIEKRQLTLKNGDLFLRHQRAVESRDGKIGSDSGPYTAFFLPRLNYFLGRFLQHGGVYPDGVIRLVKKGKAYFPSKSIHEQIAIEGRVGWLENNLLHYAYPSFDKYIERFNRYTDLEAGSIKGGLLRNLFWEPLLNRNQGFFWIYFRHLGFLDGFPGFVWALFSALHFPIAYFKYLDTKEGRVE